MAIHIHVEDFFWCCAGCWISEFIAELRVSAFAIPTKEAPKANVVKVKKRRFLNTILKFLQ
jgi:hypothetical protein